jgi:hypothetical protein
VAFSYGPDSPATFLDHQESYLRGVFGFFGIADVTFLYAGKAWRLAPSSVKGRLRPPRPKSRNAPPDVLVQVLSIPWGKAALEVGADVDITFLLCERASEADWRLFTTLIGFDAAYHGYFNCIRSRHVDFPELWDFTRMLYQMPGIAGTVRLDQMKMHYYGGHKMINPTGIVHEGPDIDFSTPTRRRH